MPRNEIKKRYQLADGRVIVAYVRDGITPEDLLINGAHSSAYHVRINRDAPAVRVKKQVKDYLIKTRITI